MGGGHGGAQSILETPVLFLAIVFSFFLVVTLGFEFVRGLCWGRAGEQRERERARPAAVARAFPNLSVSAAPSVRGDGAQPPANCRWEAGPVDHAAKGVGSGSEAGLPPPSAAEFSFPFFLSPAPARSSET